MNEDEKRILKCCYLLPSNSVSESLLKQLLPYSKLSHCSESWKMRVAEVHKKCLEHVLSDSKKIIDQKVTGAYFQGFLDAAAILSTDNLSSEEVSSLKTDSEAQNAQSIVSKRVKIGTVQTSYELVQRR